MKRSHKNADGYEYLSRGRRRMPPTERPTGATEALCECPDGHRLNWSLKDSRCGMRPNVVSPAFCGKPVTWVEAPVMERVKGWTEVKCCGRWLACHGFTTSCPRCGADFNWNGDHLAPRSCWGEETGEHPADIARIP